MQNEQIYDLAINHSLAPFLKHKQIQVLSVKKIKSSSKINLKNVSWWMFIKKAQRFKLPIIAKLSKKRDPSM
jgi:predicted nucleotide-binding protein (sugar kinase/HSP70/actin superfamily)